MAKLNVKVINETVEYNGVVYESVTGGAKTNDLIQCFEDDSVDLTYGAFYLVIGTDDSNDMQFLDDDNDERDRSVTDEDFKVFRKSHAITNDKLSDAEGVVAITLPDGTKLEGTPSDLEKITRSMQKMQAEQVATVQMPEEVAEGVLEAKQALLKEGDFARVIANTSNHCFEIGTVVKLKSPNSTVSFTAYYLDESDFWGVYREDLEPLTKEETEHITGEAEEEKKAKSEREKKEAERAKWAAIGREVGEIKKGDIVCTVSHCGSVNPVGTIGVARGESTVDSCSTVALGGKSGNWSRVELIVPVEQRFDTVG